MNGQSMLFDPDEGRRRGEAGAAVALNADRVRVWSWIADDWLNQQPRGTWISSDDLVQEVGLPDEGPNRNNAVGGWFQAQAKAGRIRDTGRRRKSARAIRHAGDQRIWEVL